MALVAEEHLHVRPIDELGIVRATLSQDSVHRLRRRSAGERDGKTAMVGDRAPRTRNKFVGRSASYFVKVVKNAEIGHDESSGKNRVIGPSGEVNAGPSAFGCQLSASSGSRVN